MLVPLVLSACTAARMGKNLEASVVEQKREFRDILGRFQTEPSETISWNAAYKRMVSDNLSLRQSRQQKEDSKKQKTRQWQTLIPRVSSYVNIGSSISDLSDLSTDDLNASLLANFNIPNPFEFYAALYGASLQQQNAIWSHELDTRRAYTQLYSSFVERDAIDKAEAAYGRKLKSLLGNQSGDMSALVNTVTVELESLEQRKLYHRLSVNQLLNTPGANWKLDGKLPQISYEGRFKRLVVGERFGKLALNLQAIQIEGAILRVKQVKFRQWPSINFGLSNPPLYTTNGTNEFSSDDLQLFSGANKSFDLADIGGRQEIRDAETRLKFTREQLRQRAEYEASSILQLVRGYELLIGKGQYLEREIKRLGRTGSLEPEIVIKDLERRSDLDLQLIENQRQIQQTDLQFLIWDETFWN